MVTVLFVFMIIGLIAQKIIGNMTKEAEERYQREEAKKREEEAAAQAAAEEAALAEELARQGQMTEESGIEETVATEYADFTEPIE